MKVEHRHRLLAKQATAEALRYYHTAEKADASHGLQGWAGLSKRRNHSSEAFSGLHRIQPQVPKRFAVDCPLSAIVHSANTCVMRTTNTARQLPSTGMSAVPKPSLGTQLGHIPRALVRGASGHHMPKQIKAAFRSNISNCKPQPEESDVRLLALST